MAEIQSRIWWRRTAQDGAIHRDASSLATSRAPERPPNRWRRRGIATWRSMLGFESWTSVRGRRVAGTKSIPASRKPCVTGELTGSTLPHRAVSREWSSRNASRARSSRSSLKRGAFLGTSWSRRTAVSFASPRRCCFASRYRPPSSVRSITYAQRSLRSTRPALASPCGTRILVAYRYYLRLRSLASIPVNCALRSARRAS